MARSCSLSIWWFSLSERVTNLMNLVMLVRHRHVHDGEHHEDVGLEHDDQDMENGPAQSEDHRSKPSDSVIALETVRCPQPQQQEQDLASVHVAEQTQGVRKRLRDVLHHLEEKIRRDQERMRAE